MTHLVSKLAQLSAGCRSIPALIVVLAGAVNLTAAELPAAAQRVGNLGRKECLVFDGAQTFSRAGILSQLDMRLEFYGRSDPEAPLADYVAWIEKTVRQGYQHSGFAKADIKAAADRAAERIVVRVTEGPRFKCGAVKVTGLDATLTQQLTNLLQKAGALGEASRDTGQPSFFWAWVEGDHAPTDPVSLTNCERNVTAALAELNRHGAEVKVAVALDEARQEADLLVQVSKAGVEGTLDQIEVEGLRVNSSEDLLSFLQLRTGTPVLGNVTNDIVRRLYESGRFSGHLARLTPLTEPGHFKLEVAVFEYTNAPALKQELSPEEKAFLKLREWVLTWKQRPEDWLVEAQMTRNGRQATAEIALGQEGLAILLRQPSATNSGTLRFGIVAAPEHVGFYSGAQQSKLSGKPAGGQLLTYVELNASPSDDVGDFRSTIGAGWSSQSHGNPYSMRVEIAPVTFLAYAHPRAGTCRVEQGILTYRSEPEADPAFELSVDAATGRLMTWSMTQQTNDIRLALRCKEGAYARVLREVADSSAGFKNALDARHPWSSSLALLGRDLRETVEREFPEILDLSKSSKGRFGSPQELLELVTVLEDMPWSELFAPMDLFVAKEDEKDAGEDFTVVLDVPPSLQTGSSEWIRLLGGMLLKANDGIYPRGSWPWAVVRDATFLAAGEPRWATNDLARLVESKDLGPLGCLVAAHALGRFDPRPAVAFSLQGAERSSAAALQADLRVLLRGEEAGPKFLRGVLQRAPALKEHEVRTLIKLFGTNALPIALECCDALKASPGAPPEEALRPVIERHWERELRPQLLTEFTAACLAGEKKLAVRPDSAPAKAAAGWLREAAEKGYAPAQMRLGELYVQGLGVTSDPQEAAKWFRLAAAQNYPHAACDLGRLYAKLGGAEALKEAQRWFRIGARDNCAAAEIGLARLLLEPKDPTPEQREEGIGWLRKAAEHGSAEAEFYLGMVLEQLNKIDEALDHYRKAATKGVLPAQMKLGDLLSDGISTKPDLVEAWVWLAQAAGQGDRMAAAQARRVERKLDADQLREAKRRLRQLE